MRKTTFVLYLLIFDINVMLGNLELQNESEITLSLQPLPYFRRLVEETIDDTSPLEPGVTEYSSQNIGNIFIKNAKQILKSDNDETDDFVSSAGILSNFMSKRNPSLYFNVLDDLVHVPSDNFNPKNTSISTTRKKSNPLSFLKQQPNTKFYQENELFNGIREHIFAKKTVDNKKYAPAFKENDELTLKTKDRAKDNSRNLADAIDSHDNTITAVNNFRIDFLNNTQRRVNTHNSLNGTSYFSTNVDKADFENKMMDLDRKYRLLTSTMNTKVTHSVFYHTSRKNRFANIKSGTIDNSLHSHTTNNGTNEVPLDQLPFFKNKKFFDPAIAKTYPTNCNKKPLEAILKQDENAAKCTGIDNKTSCGKQNKSLSRFTIKEHENQRKLSCIKCDNAAVDWCSSPREKLIPSTLCKHETDVCYSMHTPFGIIERGCYNALYTMSIYVCNCNLCNFLPFIEMPTMFTSKRQWIRNVYEMSHLKTFRRNTIKKISCLECTVNGSIAGDAVYNINCLEGRIEVIKAVTCKEGEVCAVKAIRKQGYIWRGCVSRPRYNYYVTLCNEDLCNDEPIASIYDTLN